MFYLSLISSTLDSTFFPRVNTSGCLFGSTWISQPFWKQYSLKCCHDRSKWITLEVQTKPGLCIDRHLVKFRLSDWRSHARGELRGKEETVLISLWSLENATWGKTFSMTGLYDNLVWKISQQEHGQMKRRTEHGEMDFLPFVIYDQSAVYLQNAVNAIAKI